METKTDSLSLRTYGAQGRLPFYRLLPVSEIIYRKKKNMLTRLEASMRLFFFFFYSKNEHLKVS